MTESGFDELVRDSLATAVTQVRQPADLPARAVRMHRRRRLLYTAAAGAGAAVTATAIAIAAVGGPALVPPPHDSKAAAVLLSKTESALARGKLVMQESTPLDLPGSSITESHGQRSVREVTWAYGGHYVLTTYGYGGRPQGALGTAVIRGKARVIAIDYIAREWQLNVIPNAGPPGPCSPHSLIKAVPQGTTPSATASWQALIRRALRCGSYRFAGYRRVDGVRTAVLATKAFSESSHSAPEVVTIYVSTSTYLPVRISDLGNTQYMDPVVRDYQWLSATPANLARTVIVVPSGFDQVAPGHLK